MTKIGKSMVEWLRNITLDQNLNKLGDVENTPVDYAGKPFFESRELKPYMQAGYYDTSTNRWVMGVPSSSVNLNSTDEWTMLDGYTESVDNTSVGNKEWTVTAGKVWIILDMGGVNDTRAPSWVITLTRSGGAAIDLCRFATSQLYETNFMQASLSTAAGQPMLGNRPMVLAAGDKIKITNLNFIAADAMEYYIRYVEVTP